MFNRNVILGSFLTLSLAPTLAFAGAAYKAGNYDVDPAHSKLGFEVPHLVISTVEGKFDKFDGKAELAEKFEKSKFTVSAEAASIDTGVAKRDEHLRSPDFFDAAKFPNLTFTSTKVAGKPDSFKLTGDLTIHGVTKSVTFDAKYLGAVDDGMGHEKAAFTAKTKINRKDFGLKWGGVVEAGPVVGDEVTLDLRIEAGHPSAKKGT
jgi:polyisoprenoid-binding protein YceI